jgi:hypothetical protein
MFLKLMMALGGLGLLFTADAAMAASITSHEASGATTLSVFDAAAWHGGLMVLAWVVLMPAALLVARFYKITPGQDWPRHLDNPFWFVNHRRLGYAIMLTTIIALAFIAWDQGGVILWQSHHAVAGWTLVALGGFQIVGSLLRGTHGGPMDPFTRKLRPPEQWPGDHFSFTQRRIVFEYSHKLAGYLLVPLTVWTVADGLDMTNAPRWIWLIVGSWTIICVGAFVRLQRMGRCFDTYQAIWGPDETLPGNRRKPIGWGIRRVRGP